MEFKSAECRQSERHYVEGPSAQCRQAERYYVECHSAECRGAATMVAKATGIVVMWPHKEPKFVSFLLIAGGVKVLRPMIAQKPLFKMNGVVFSK